MPAPKITIGMAHHSDFHGAYFTIQALRLYHAEALRQCEIVVVDNSFGTKHSQELARICNGTIAGRAYNPGGDGGRGNWVDGRPPEALEAHWNRAGLCNIRVVPMEGATSTSATRGLIFELAAAPAVLVLDCHVMLPPGALEKLLDWYDAPAAERQDLYSGPLLYDQLTGYSQHAIGEIDAPRDITTHFDPIWGGEMFGRWGKAWRFAGVELATRPRPLTDESGGVREVVEYRTLVSQVPITETPAGEPLPLIDWPGHQHAMKQTGFEPLGERDDDAPFEIPGNGLGLFSCRKDAWPGFHPLHRGFGGEELYIHEKFRQAGNAAVCLPFLKWLHRFGRPDGVPYPLSRYDKARNYVLEWQELGRDIEEIRVHFVDEGQLPAAAWQHLLENPEEHIDPPELEQNKTCSPCVLNRKIDQAATLDELYATLVEHTSELDEHLPLLRGMATECQHVTEIGKHRESTVALLSGRPPRFVGLLRRLENAANRAAKYATQDDCDVVLEQRDDHRAPIRKIEPTDMLVIDDIHTAKVLGQQLANLAPFVSRWIVLHGTQLHGEVGADGGPGLLDAMRAWLRENPKWSVLEHRGAQAGVTVLGCQDADKKPLPKLAEMAGNLGKALIGFAGSGGKMATKEQLEARLLVCSACPHRRNTQCSVCGCFLNKKAQILASECPLDYWAEVDAEAAKKKGEQ